MTIAPQFVSPLAGIANDPVGLARLLGNRAARLRADYSIALNPVAATEGVDPEPGAFPGLRGAHNQIPGHFIR